MLGVLKLDVAGLILEQELETSEMVANLNWAETMKTQKVESSLEK